MKNRFLIALLSDLTANDTLSHRSVQMAPIRTGSHPACGRVVPALLAFLPLEELLAERLLQPTAFDSMVATLQNQVRCNAARRDSCRA